MSVGSCFELFSDLAESQRLTQNIQCSVHVTIMQHTTTLTHPLTLRQPQLIVLVAAVVAEPGTRIEPIHLNERPPVPLRLISEFFHETAPPVSEDATVHRALGRLAVSSALAVRVQLLFRLPRHIPHRQSLHANELVIFYQPMRHLVLEVLAEVTNLRVRFGYSLLLLAVVTRTLHPARQLTLFTPNLLLQLSKPVRLVNFLACGQCKEAFDTQVDTNLATHRRIGLNIHIEQKHQIVHAVLSLHRPTQQ